jgi:uncharacterized membrane protein HdeD (DUF308 family)
MLIVWSGNWWVLALRGVLSILFGIIAVMLPGPTLAAMIMLFGAFALVDGVLAIVLAVRGMRSHERWGGMLVTGLISIAAGLVTFLWPAIGALTLIYIIAAWALVTGVFEIVAAVKLRKLITGEWMLLTAGILSVLLGALTMIFPGIGLLAFVWYLAAYAIVYGIVVVMLAFQVRKLASATV